MGEERGALRSPQAAASPRRRFAPPRASLCAVSVDGRGPGRAHRPNVVCTHEAGIPLDRSFSDWDFSEGLGWLSAPVLVVYAGDDSLAVAEQRAWAGAFPDGRLLLVPGADKGAITERPDIVRPAVVTPERVWASADFGIDRQLWGIQFDGRTSTLRNAIVHDLIQLELTLVADARGEC